MPRRSRERGQRRADEVLRLLKSETNLQILALLSSKPSYPRELALLLGKDETDISRRLRRMESLGVVEGFWARFEDRNVKLYRLACRGLSIRFENGNIVVEAKGAEDAGERLSYVKSVIPDPGIIVGREKEKFLLSSVSTPVVLVWGPPGVGKTSLLASVIRTTSGDRPVYWYSYMPGDTATSFQWRLGLFLENYVDPELHLPIEGEELVDALEYNEVILVIDDYHLLREEVKDYVRWLAKRVVKARLYILSRSRDPRLPHASGRVFELELKPLPPSAGETLIHTLYRELGVVASREEISRILTASQGIPLLIKGMIKLHLEQGTPLDRAIKEIIQNYFSGQALNMLNDEQRQIVEVLAVARGSLPIEVLCRLIGKQGLSCMRQLKSLSDLGVISIGEDTVLLREFMSRLVNIMQAKKKEMLASIVAKALIHTGSYRDKVFAVDLLAEYCRTGPAAEIIANRMLTGEGWFLCCPEYYLSALDKLQSCIIRSTYELAVFALEKAIVGRLSLEGDRLGAIEVFARFLPALRNNIPLYTRLSLLYVIALYVAGHTSDAEQVLEEAEKLYKILYPRKKRLVASTYYSAKLMQAYYNNDLDGALQYAEKQASEDLNSGHLLSYVKSKLDVALLYIHVGKFKKAEETLSGIEELIAVQPKRTRIYLQEYVHLLKAFISLSRGDPDYTLALVREYEENPAWRMYNVYIYLAKALALALRGEKEELVKTLEELGIPCDNRNIHEQEDKALCALKRYVEGRESEELLNSLSRGYRILVEKALKSLGKTNK